MTTTLIEAPTIAPAPDKPVELNETGKVLLRARDILLERGWVQGVSGAPGGPRCVGGAMSEASDSGHAVETFTRFVTSVGIRLGGVAPWNDAPGRTREEVVLALERAAYQV